MNWENLLGTELYALAKQYTKANKLTMLGFVRELIREFFRNKGE